jgi:nucleoside-diphosphate-sugar epimerase
MKTIIVTGGSGKAGRAIIADLLKNGYAVCNVDQAPPPERICRFLRADLTDLGQTLEALRGADAVVHLAAIPAPGIFTDEVTFRNNTTSTYNVFQAAVNLALKRVVWASSETTLGLPFERVKPHYAPIDEKHPLQPESTYALSKVVGETMADHFSRWSGIPFVGLRISNIMEPPDYAKFPSWWSDPRLRKWNLWGYVDARDVAQVCRLALTASRRGADNFIIAAADTCMDRPSRALMAEVFPQVPLRGDFPEHGTLLSIEKAKADLGYVPNHSWRNHVKI